MADARQQVEQLLAQFSIRCAEAGVSSKVLEDVGLPADRLTFEAQRYDLILLGQRTRFHFVIQDRHDETLTNVLKDSPRPVVVVPEEAVRGHSVVVAYDGSLQAARALHAFVATGLGSWGPAHVVCVTTDRLEAARHAERAVDYLRSHAIQAESHPLASGAKPAGVILEQARSLDVRLLVMGAYGQPGWHEFFLGSTTRTVLHDSPLPVFLYH
jgi:nucleotide-binding universal stress UspA family protein